MGSVVEDSWGSAWSDVVDVIVVGTGSAGLAAAISAARRGSSVLVLEKSLHGGGTTAKSSGTMWFPNNTPMREHGLSDDRASALRYMARVSYPDRYTSASPTLGLTCREHSLLEALYDHGAEAFDELVADGAIPYDQEAVPGFPDYHADLPEDAAPVGRSIRIAMQPGYRPGSPGMTGGQHLVNTMMEVARSYGVEIRFDHRVHGAIRDADGAVVGLEVRRRRDTLLIGARRGVIFATGGFLHNEAMSQAFLRGPVYGGAADEGAEGDFIRIASEVGAQLGNMSHAWWDQVTLESALRTRSTIRDCTYLFGDSMIIVDRWGHRVMNEKSTYNERGQVHFVWDPQNRDYSHRILLLLFDDHVVRDARFARHRYPVPTIENPDEGWEAIISADTWHDLAQAVQARLVELGPQIGEFVLADSFIDNLNQTIERFNAFADSGVDADFRRGESPIEKAWATTPRHENAPNPTMFRFGAGPFHCVLLGGGALDTKGGPVIDPAARVLDHQDQPIPGLFGAGNCIASPTGQGYYGPGGTIGPAITFGWLAGRSAATAAPRSHYL